MDALFATCFKDWRSFRSWGREGIAIEYYCYHRFGIESHGRQAQQWHAVHMSPFGHIAEESGTIVDRLAIRSGLWRWAVLRMMRKCFRLSMQKPLAEQDIIKTFVAM